MFGERATTKFTKRQISTPFATKPSTKQVRNLVKFVKKSFNSWEKSKTVKNDKSIFYTCCTEEEHQNWLNEEIDKRRILPC
ncbi:uncharacterized protein LOC119644926 [Glossina fuscipes]|uniref:Uncharacterized protein LOC119644926 n=1 Tax=Glossina fuscipes TaxID=7396 RepID=A0A9C5ZJ16_9MUSC|nr:uncharacterized protein LOC119644926 [Glossina fuscipes]